MKKKFIIIIAVIVVVVAVGAFFCIRAYNNYITQQQIEERLNEIDEMYDKFESETDRDTRMKILVDFIKDKPSTNDEVSVEVLDSVEPEYNDVINKMCQYFIDEYNSILSENTLLDLEKEDKEKIKALIKNLNSLTETIESEKSVVFETDNSEYTDIITNVNNLVTEYRQYFIDEYNAVLDKNTFKSVDKIEDKDKLNSAVENLNALKKTVDNEKDIVFDADSYEYDDLIAKTDGLITKYKNRVKVIEKAEEKAKQESSNSSDNVSSSNSDSTNYNNNYSQPSNSNSSNSSSNSNNSNDGEYRWWSYTNEDGGTSYRDSNNNFWSDEGSYTGDGDGWFNP